MTWTALTDAQRRIVLFVMESELESARNEGADGGSAAGFAEAIEAARAVLLVAREERIAVEAVATHGEAATARDLQAEGLRDARNEARAACELALRAAAASLACSTCQGRHGAVLVEEAIRLVTWPAPAEVVEPLQAAARAHRAEIIRQRDDALRERDEARSVLRDGVLMLRGFYCQRDPPCSEALPRGGCCNSCWARSWAGDVRLP